MLVALKESRVKAPKVEKIHHSFSNCSLFQTDLTDVAGPEKYWTYRWIHVVDGTSDHPFILELFSSSQPEIFNHICPSKWPGSCCLGALLPCREPFWPRLFSFLQWPTWCVPKWEFVKWTVHWPIWRAAPRLRRSSQVCPAATRSAWYPAVVVTVSVCCLVQTGYHKGQPYVSDPKVKSFIQWTKSLKDNAVLEKTAIGGYYCYPHPPQKCPQTGVDSLGEENQQTAPNHVLLLFCQYKYQHKSFMLQFVAWQICNTNYQTDNHKSKC